MAIIAIQIFLLLTTTGASYYFWRVYKDDCCNAASQCLSYFYGIASLVLIGFIIWSDA
jgi:hypothetical protein